MALTPPPSSMDDDVVLLRRLAAGDQSAMPQLFRRHHAPIQRFIVRMTRDRALAEDLTHEVFLEVWRNAGRFEGRSAVRTWILSIAHHRTVSVLRKRSETLLDEEQAIALADPSDNPELAITKLDKGTQIRACMDQLSPAHREILDLVYYQEQSIAQIETILGIPQGTVKTRLFHARKQLGERLRRAGIERGWP